MAGRPRVERLRLRHAPALFAAMAFAVGIVAARAWKAPGLIAAVVAALFLLSLWAVARGLRTAVVAVLACCVAVGCWCAQVERPVDQQAELRGYADGLLRHVRGRVERVRAVSARAEDEDDPAAQQTAWEIEPGGWQQERGAAAEQVDVAVERVERVTPDESRMEPVRGGVRLSVVGAASGLRCGDVVEADVRLRVPDTLRDPGAFSGADAMLADGVGTTAAVQAEKISHVGAGRAGFRCRVFAAQSWASARLDAFLNSRAEQRLPKWMRLNAADGAVLRAMLFGDRSALGRTLKVGFERTGTFHLFVISGLHVTLLAGGLMWLLRRLRMREWVCVVATLGVAAGYAVLTGFSVPVERALLMTAAYLLARVFAREASALNAMGVAALLVLGWDPWALFEASFQMTFLVILAVAGVAQPLRERTFGPYARALRNLELVNADAAMEPRLAAFRVRLRMWKKVAWDATGRWGAWVPVVLVRIILMSIDLMLMGFAVEVCMVLPVAVYFHRAALMALPVNLLLLPLAGVLLGTAVAMFCLSLAGAWAALPVAVVVAVALHGVRLVVRHAGQAAGADWRMPGPGVAALCGAAVLLVFAVWALRERRRAWVWGGCCAALMVPLVVLWPAGAELHKGELEVTAIDVGQGDSLLVVTPEGRTLLVDAGGPVGGAVAASGWDVGEDVVAPYLWTRGIARLDAVLLTHAHSDHMGGMAAVLRDLRPRVLWISVEPGQSRGLPALLEEAAALGISVERFHAGDRFGFGGVDMRVLAPEAGYANAGAAKNDDSLVMEMAYGKSRVLLEGDAEAPSERAMLANGRVQPATLLKVGHHGSRTSTTEEFLEAVRPREAVISVGRRNTFGHPRADVLARLEAEGARVYRTDRDGAETFLLDREGGVRAAGANP
jgi:competence protein ComEC